MKNVMIKSTLFFCLIVLLGSCISQKPVEFILLQSSKDSGEPKYNKLYYSAIYIVKNYSDHKKSQMQIDSFAMNLGNKNQTRYNSYLLMFYRESAITNLKNLKENPRDLDRYSDIKDHRLDYHWSGGTFLGKMKYRNGVMIDPKSNIKLEDAPPLKH